MDNHLNAALRAILEAVTEFLPVSSTGHLFLFSHFFPFSGLGDLADAFEDLYDIFIQSGAILSVIFLYRKKLGSESLLAYQYFVGKTQDRTGFLFFQSILIGILPILVLGFLGKSFLDVIKQRADLLFIIGLAWLVGGIVMLVVELFATKKEPEELHIPNAKQSLLIGFFQCFALIPGVSRSAATIISARFLGIGKKDSAEYSFFLAVPVLLIAGLYKLYKHRSILTADTLSLLLFGSLISFLLCIFVIKLFLSFLRRRSFASFGVYRIILGLVTIHYFYRFHTS